MLSLLFSDNELPLSIATALEADPTNVAVLDASKGKLRSFEDGLDAESEGAELEAWDTNKLLVASGESVIGTVENTGWVASLS